MSELDRKDLAKKLDIHYQAFDIYRETGLTPRQLADQRAELLAALGQMLAAHNTSAPECVFARTAIANAERKP